MVPMCVFCCDFEAGTFSGGDEHFCSGKCVDAYLNELGESEPEPE